MPQTNLYVVNERELSGHWVAVQSSGEGVHLPSGEVLVDYDAELDQLCQRVAAARHSGLTIFRYPSSPPAHPSASTAN